MKLKILLISCFVTLISSLPSMANDKKIMTIAGGCFWCMEPIFESNEGVNVTAGYAGGDKANPTYENMGDHIEAAQVEFDPAKISYEELLKIYWYNIDAFDAGGQFYDRGSHYQTAIFYHDDAQKKAAEESRTKIEKDSGKKVATKILPFKNFYPAEDYHQDFYKKNADHYNRYKKGSGREERLKEIWKK